MIKRLITISLFAVLLIAAASEVKVTVDDIIKLKNEGLSSEIIISFIDSSSQVFDLTPDDIVKLKKEGVSEEIIKKMLDTKKKAQHAPETSTTVVVPPSEPSLTQRITGNRNEGGSKIIIEPNIEHEKKYPDIFFLTVYQKKVLGVPQRTLKIGEYNPLSNVAQRSGTLFLTKEALLMYNDKGELKFELPYKDLILIKIVNRYPDSVDARHHPIDRYQLRVEFNVKGKPHFLLAYALPYENDDGSLSSDKVVILANDLYDLAKSVNSKLEKLKRVN